MPCNAWLTIGDAVTLAIYSDPACPAAAGCLGSPEEAVALQCRFCKRGAAGPAAFSTCAATGQRSGKDGDLAANNLMLENAKEQLCSMRCAARFSHT